MVKMTSKAKNFPLFLSGLVAVSCLLNFYSVYAGNSGIDWLEAGSYAVYSFGLKGEKPELTFLGFDDCGLSILATGNYSWRCIEVEVDYAKLEVEINLLVDGSVTYVGKEFVEKANNSDLSFIKRIPMDQVVGRIQVMSDMVRIPGPVYIQENLVVTVDLNTMELIDESEKAWGKWVMWIDPLKYPLEGETLETFIVNWLNTTVDLYVSYNDGTQGPPIDTLLGRFERYFVAGRPPIENEFLLKLGVMTQSWIVLTYTYDPRSGILLAAEAENYIDDLLTQELGVILTFGTFILSETNVSIEQDGEFDLSPFIPYLAVLGISGTIVGAYLVRKKRHSFQ